MLLCLFCIDKIVCLCSGRGSYLCMYARIRTAYYIIIISNNSRCMCECTCVCVYIRPCMSEFLNGFRISGCLCLLVWSCLPICACLPVCHSAMLLCTKWITVSIWSVSAVSPTAPRDGRYANSGSGAVNKFSGSVGKLLKLVYHKDHKDHPSRDFHTHRLSMLGCLTLKCVQKQNCIASLLEQVPSKQMRI